MLIPCEDEISCGGGGGGDGGSSTASNTYKIHVKKDVNTTTQVLLGYIQLTEQLDGIFKGGSDLRFVFVDVVEIFPGRVEAKKIYKKKDLTRRDVSRKRWKNLYLTVDNRWHTYQKTLPFQVYEHDRWKNGADVTFEYTLEDINGNSIVIESTFEIAKNRDDIDKFYFDRKVFHADNENNAGNGKKDGFQIYKGNHGFSFTLPHRKINL